MQFARSALITSLATLLVLAVTAGTSRATAHEATPGAKVGALGYQEMMIRGADYAFEGVPATIEAGYTLITFENVGEDVHLAQLVKLNEGVTLEEATPLVHEVGVSEELEPFENFMGHVTFYGGPMLIAPGGRQQLILDLEPGQYLWICWVDAPDGEIHSDKGMIQSFEVVAATADSAMEEPASDGTLALHDFSFEMPDPIGAGPQVWEVVNDGAQPHEFFLAQLAPGVTAMELLMAEDWEGLGMPFGGMAVIAPNVSSWLVLDLPPGSYAAFCFVPDPESGSAHLELGMMAEFTVADAT